MKLEIEIDESLHSRIGISGNRRDASLTDTWI
jgi:hypothetical protein